nr:kinesin-like protein KIN-5B [Tanacetum cinerariifolium]
MAETMVVTILKPIFQKLADEGMTQVIRIKGIHSELENLKKTLSRIQPLVIDAAEKEIKEVLIQNWLNDLKHLAYDIEDILDDLATDAINPDLTTRKVPILVNAAQHVVDCTNKVGNSLQHWDNTKLANGFNERNMVEIGSFIRETIQLNNLSEEIAAAYVFMDTKFQSDASDLKSCVNGDKHGDSTKSMLNQAEGLKKDYQVDQNCHPRKREIDVPSLTSI